MRWLPSAIHSLIRGLCSFSRLCFLNIVLLLLSSWLSCYSGSWVWTWLYEMTMGTSWTQMKPARSLSSSPTKPHPKGLMRESRKRRYVSCHWLFLLHVTSTHCICTCLLRRLCYFGSRTKFFCLFLMGVLFSFAVPATEFRPPRAANIQHDTYI